MLTARSSPLDDVDPGAPEGPLAARFLPFPVRCFLRSVPAGPGRRRALARGPSSSPTGAITSCPVFQLVPRTSPRAVIKEFCKTVGANTKVQQGLIRLAKTNGGKLGFLA